VDFKVNGTSKFSIDSTGAMTSSVGTSGTTANYTSASGSQLVVGYDGTNKTTMDVGITGFTTLSAAGVGAGFNLSGGPVGVGVPFPGEALDVAGSIRSSTSVKAPLLSNTTDLTLTADSDANASGALILNTGTNERMRILNNGNVGIGTTAPTTGKLSIYHQVDPGTTPAALSIVTPGMPGGTATAQYGIKVDGVSYNSSTVMYGVYSKAKGNIGQTSYGVYGETEGAAIQNTYGVYGKGFQSDTNGAGISYGVYGTVTSAGLNGTGKTYAGYFDNQATTGNTSVGLYVNSAGGATNNYSAILMGGNVGIGTINPTSPLKVNGRIAVGRQGIVSGSYNPGEVVGIWSIGEGYQVDTTANTFGNHYGLVYAHSDSTRSITGWGHQILGVQNGTMTFALSTTAGNAHFSGNVGIGTTSPSVKLDVVGGISIQNNNNLTWGGTYGAGIPTIASTVGDGIYFYPTGSTSGATVSMKGSGNVGIGTAAPLEKLSVVGNIVVSNANSFGWGNRTTQIIGEDNTTGGNGMRFDTNGVEKMRLDVSGNLGVGISSPTAKLDVAGIIQSNTGSNAGEYRIGGTSVLSATSGATLLINSGGFTTVDIAGRVGFPTASATHKILVTGTAGLSTGTAWTNTSDIRLKDVHGNYEYGLEEILKLNTVRFNYKKDNAMDLPSDVPMIGFVAQEVKKVIPDAVTENGSGYLELNVDPIHWAVVNAIKELYSKLMGHDEDITILKKQVQRLPALEKENLELKQENAKKAKEMAAIKAYLCSKDPKAAICNL
ncbi:MAG TPA: tail fiber domain-containing protein, partial [Bacteriovoracaceae bacterium]|nr:tail fiber domain-containing protein [Bacteriovoracaceae bacterium]